MSESNTVAERSRLLLASASPRRRELLALLGVDYRVVVSRFDEGTLAHLTDPVEYVQRAAEKPGTARTSALVMAELSPLAYVRRPGFSEPVLPSSIIILNVTASSNARRSSPITRCTLSNRYTKVFRWM